MSNTATFIGKVNPGARGDMELYELNPPLHDEYAEGAPFRYVVVSTVIAPFSGPETYIFPADEQGNILSYGELEGSFRGALSHTRALNNAGYEVVA